MNDYCTPQRRSQDIFAEKDPDSTIDYEFKWGAFLDGDTIDASVFLLPDGLTQVSSSLTDSTARIFVSGGTCGCVCRITNRITTAGGRVHDKTIKIAIREQ